MYTIPKSYSHTQMQLVHQLYYQSHPCGKMVKKCPGHGWLIFTKHGKCFFLRISAWTKHLSKGFCFGFFLPEERGLDFFSFSWTSVFPSTGHLHHILLWRRQVATSMHNQELAIQDADSCGSVVGQVASNLIKSHPQGFLCSAQQLRMLMSNARDKCLRF